MTADALRSARLLFARERAAGVVDDAGLDHPAVRRAGLGRGLRAPWVRVAQRVAMRRGRLTLDSGALGPLAAARRAVLGSQSEPTPPRVLLRMDEYPHYRALDEPDRYGDAAFARWQEIMAEAGCRHLVAVVPAPCRRPMEPDGPPGEPLDALQSERLRSLQGEGVALALHGYDHRTRDAHPRRQSELSGLAGGVLDARLAAGQRLLAERTGASPTILVPPWNRFDAAQWPTLARRFAVITGGPESVLTLGFHPAPTWIGDAVYLPAYAPLYGTAEQVLAGVGPHLETGSGLWLPVVLHWGWEADRGWEALRRLADRLAPYAADWEEFLNEVEASR